MFLRPILICAAGVLALQLLTVRADSGVNSLEIPKGWSASDSIGKQYFMGYDTREKAYYIENIGPIEPTGRLINSDTVPWQGGHHVPYTVQGIKPTDPWSAALLQSVKALPFRHHKLRLEAEVKSLTGYEGKFYLMFRGAFPSGMQTVMTDDTRVTGNEWRTLVAEIDLVPDDVTDHDDSSLTFGFLMQGEGRVLIRGLNLTSSDVMPENDHPDHGSYLQDMFSDPPLDSQPVNLELSR